MNYGKLSTDATKKRLASKSGMTRRKIGTHLFRLFIVVLLAGIAIFKWKQDKFIYYT